MKIFISYSCEDERRKDELLRFATPLIQRYGLELWNDRHIEAGSDWTVAVEQAIEHANIAIVLLSASFLNSPLCVGHQLQSLLARRMLAGGPRIVPVLLSPCLWREQRDLAVLQVLPRDGRPLYAHRTKSARERAIAEVWTTIQSLLPAQDSSAAIGTSLPEQPIGFASRHGLQTALERALIHGPAVLVGLAGAGGVGKTTLAADFARQYRDRFDTIAWVDVRSRGGGTSGTAELLLTKLGHPDILVDRAQNAFAVVAPILRQRAVKKLRTLVIFDNADYPDVALTSFIDRVATEHGCKVIVTTRRQDLATQLAAEPIEVGSFAKEEAVACVTSLLDESDPRRGDLEGLRRIVCHEGCIPLWVHLAGTLLRRHHRLPLKEYGFTLSAFERVAAELSDDELGLFAACGACSSIGSTVGAVARAADLDESTAREGLQRLHAWSLVQTFDGHNVSLHPLMREKAQLSDEHSVAVRRHAAWLLDVLSVDTFALDQVESVKDELNAAVEQSDGDILVELCRRGWRYWSRRGPWAVADRALARAVAVARQSQDEQGVADLLWAQAVMLAGRAPWADVLTLLDEKESFDRKSGSPVILAQTLQKQSYILGVQGQVDAARKKLTESLRLWRDHDAGDRDLAIGLGDMGMLEYRAENLDKARDYFHRALATFERLNDDEHRSSMLHRLGLTYVKQREHRRAVPFLEDALRLRRQLRLTSDIVSTLNVKGACHSTLGENDRAEECYAEGLELARAHGLTFWLAENFYWLADLRDQQGRRREGVEYAREALAIHEALGATDDMLNGCRILLAQLERSRS